MVENKLAVSLSKKDFGAIFRGTSLNGMFQFVAEIKEAVGHELPDVHKNNVELKSWAEFIGQSDKMVDLIHGGNKTRIEHLMVFMKEGSEEAIVVEKKNDTYSLTKMESVEALAPTFAYAYGAYIKDQPTQWLNETMDLEAYLLTVHLLDIYKRIQFRTMMEYQQMTSFRMTLKEMMEHFDKSLKGRDSRWILPNFVFFTELFNKYKIEMTDEKISKFLNSPMVKTQKTKNGQDIVVFTDKMADFADECFNHWITCSSLQLVRLVGNDAKSFSPQFIIHTGKGNYVTRINKQGTVTNSSLDLAGFMKVMEGFFLA